MSLIVILKEDNKYVVGCDTRISGQDDYEDGYQRVPKAKHIDFHNQLIIGCVGNIGILDVVEMIVSKEEKITRGTLVKNVIPKLREITSGTSYEVSNRCLDGDILIAYKDKAYAITSNYTVINIDDMYALGSGANTAYGSLFTSRYMNVDAASRVMLSIKAAGSRIFSVSKDAWVGDTSGSPFSPKSQVKYNEK